MAPKTSIRRWKDQEKFLFKQPFRILRNTTYFLQDKNDVKVTGAYPLQQERLKNEIIDKRGTGQPVCPEWIGNRMFQICVDEMPSGFDPTNKNQFNKRWVSNYMSRKSLSIRQATNKKKQSVFEKLHKIHGFHWYTQYQMAFGPLQRIMDEDTTSESFESSEEEESEDNSSSSEEESEESSSS